MRAARVLDPGILTTVQDRGRPGWAHLGVSRSGWLDAPAATLANRLVGNGEDAAVLECLLGGLAIELTRATTVALTGARCPATVDGRAVAHGAAVTVPAGGVLRLEQAGQGARCYLAFAGGVAVEPVLGSRATDSLSATGPPPLQRGTTLPLGPAQGVPSGVDVVAAQTPRVAVLPCLPGPRADWFAPSMLDVLGSSTYTVAPESDRIGLRLSGPRLTRARTQELPSEGLVLGAVQVPADGTPLVFLNDHPTTGGYPVVAVVDTEELWRCAQLRPGERLTFEVRRSPRRSPMRCSPVSGGAG